MNRRWSALAVGVGAALSVAACSLLVDTRGLVGSAADASANPSIDAAADASNAAGTCASTCPSGTRCISSACVPSEGLVAWWSFEEASPKVPDVSGGGNDGASYGDVTQAHGKVGMGLEVGPHGCVLVPASSALQMVGGQALTMMAWVSVQGCGVDGADHGIILNLNDGYEMAIQCGSSALQEAIETTGNWNWQGSTPVTQSAWHHVAVTWDGSTVRHYIDGEQRDSASQSGSILASSAGLGLGCRGVAADGGPFELKEWFAGSIDEVAVYTRMLSDADVRAYYNATR